MKKRRQFTAEVKTKIILEVLSEKQTRNEIARKYELSPTVLDRWLKQFLSQAPQVFESKNQETEKDKKIKKYEHVITKITTQNDFLERVLTSLE